MKQVLRHPADDTHNGSIFEQPLWVAVFAFFSAVIWGFAFPLLKLGFVEFGIAQDMTGSKMLFAGLRFSLAGVIILIIAKLSHRSFAWKARPDHDLKLQSYKDFGYLLLFTLMNTTLHYAFFYIGLSHSQGARAAILNSLGVFLLVILACLFFKSDKMTYSKALGCVIGFLGILTLNMGGGESGSFTLLGDGMMIINTFCMAIAGLMTRGVSRRIDVFVGTGYSLGVGGALLIIVGLMMGGTLPNASLWGFAILTMLIGISSIGFALYNKLLTCNPMGKVAIWNSLIPVVGAVSSCLCLGETFYWKYVFAAGMAMLGIYLLHKD